MQIASKSCNDGVTRSDNRVLGNFKVKTASYVMTKYDLGDYMSNRGATGLVRFTLPAAVEGAVARFYRVTNKSVSVTVVGASIDDHANVILESPEDDSIPAFLELGCDGTNWFTRCSTGNWDVA